MQAGKLCAGRANDTTIGVDEWMINKWAVRLLYSTISFWMFFISTDPRKPYWPNTIEGSDQWQASILTNSICYHGKLTTRNSSNLLWHFPRLKPQSEVGDGHLRSTAFDLRSSPVRAALNVLCLCLVRTAGLPEASLKNAAAWWFKILTTRIYSGDIPPLPQGKAK